MAVNKRLLQGAAAAGGLVPSEHFGVVLYEGDGSSSHSINGGKFGAAAYFDGGSSDKILIGNNLKNIFFDEFSISTWFYMTEANNYQTIVGNTDSSRDRGLLLFLRGDNNKLVWNASETGLPGPYFNVTSTNAFSANTWYHVVVSFNNSTDLDGAKIYINGSLDTSGQARTADIESSNDVHIGNSGLALDWPFHGKIDQTRFFTKALSSSEVSTLYAETVETVESLDPLSEDTTDTLQVLGDSSCIATYRFENDEVDLSGNYDGTGTSIQYAAGRYGQAASFNGSSSYVEVNNFIDGSDSTFSLSLWVKGTDTSNTIYSTGFTSNNEKLLIQGAIVKSYNGSWAESGSISAALDGSWHHLAISVSSNAATIYIDGVSTTSVTLRSLSDNNKADTIGARWTDTASARSSFFDGEIDQVRIFNKAISAAEVTTLYNENSLVASYRFEGNANDDMRAYDGTATNVTYEYGLGFTPDFVWIKRRDAGADHALTDSTRGVQKLLSSNSSAAEANQSPLGLTSFDTGGFTLADNSGGGAGINGSGFDYVAWCLKANGGTTSSNTDGTITSTVQANQEAGFSIISWTGTGSNGTIGTGLSTAADLIITKARGAVSPSVGEAWPVYHSSLPSDKIVYLDQTYAQAGKSTVYQDPTTTSTTFGVETWRGINQSGVNMISYAFHSVEGFSKFGTYTGNGSTNGPIVETGFEPAFVMVKRTDIADSWVIHDNKRDLVNPRKKYLLANGANAEASDLDGIDFLSNGFQLKDDYAYYNASGGTYIYMAFAADPDTEAPTVAKSFSTVAYSGDSSSTRSIDGLGFSPSLVWIKNRTVAGWHHLSDIVRGGNNTIFSNATNAETSNIAGGIFKCF